MGLHQLAAQAEQLLVVFARPEAEVFHWMRQKKRPQHVSQERGRSPLPAGLAEPAGGFEEGAPEAGPMLEPRQGRAEYRRQAQVDRGLQHHPGEIPAGGAVEILVHARHDRRIQPQAAGVLQQLLQGRDLVADFVLRPLQGAHPLEEARLADQPGRLAQERLQQDLGMRIDVFQHRREAIEALPVRAVLEAGVEGPGQQVAEHAAKDPAGIAVGQQGQFLQARHVHGLGAEEIAGGDRQLWPGILVQDQLVAFGHGDPAVVQVEELQAGPGLQMGQHPGHAAADDHVVIAKHPEELAPGQLAGMAGIPFRTGQGTPGTGAPVSGLAS